MNPVLAFPFADPDGTLFLHLQAILPDLKNHFEHAFLCPPLSTQKHVRHMEQLQSDPFFTIFPVDREMQIGEHFAYLYRRAADAVPSDQVIHLAYLDRLAFALEGPYRETFLADIDALADRDIPMIFQRSLTAWDTHPKNYRELEAAVTTVGRNLFGLELDYAWCHLAVTAGQLREVLPHVKNPDLSMVAELVFHLQGNVHTRDVDWLAWEDPFLLNRDADELKRERENSLEENRKRLRYILPMIETLARLSKTEIPEAGRP
jgi:hypothetical protein